MSKIMTDEQVLELLRSPGIEVNNVQKEVAQTFVIDTVEPRKIKCASPDKAKSLMFLARRIGMDAYSRCSVLTVFVPVWMSGVEDKLNILASQCS